MTQSVEMPLWVLLLILAFAAIAALDKIMIPSVRWYFRRRLEKAVARLNERLDRPIQPFKLARRFDMIQRIIYDPDVAQAVADHAREKGIPENVAFEQARRYAREIVPSFSASAYFGFAIRAARWLSNALYRVKLWQVDEVALREIDPESTVVFVMNHRSNMDYVLVTYLAAERSALSYAVGEWAQVWPLSRLIRAMGAYFIRRRSRDELYRKVLACYVRLATQAGVTQAMFPEGGLSQKGGLMPPKLGLLKYIVDAQGENGRDVVFVPVALNYDRVLEDRILIKAAQTKGSRFDARIGVIAGHSLRQVWLRLTGRYHRFGYAGVKFGAPVYLSKEKDVAKGDVSRHLARHLMKQIGALTPILPVPLVSWLLIEYGPSSRVDLERRLNDLLSQIPKHHVFLPRSSRGYTVEVALRDLTKRQILDEANGLFSPRGAQLPVLEFYARSIAHLMPPKDAATAKENSATAGS